MNKDLDERLVPNGEYRDALNVEISSSEGANIGSVQTLRSNLEVASNISKHPSAFTMGSYVDESDKCIYNFVKDASNFDVTLVAGLPKKTGVRSDLIEKLNVNSSYNNSQAYSSQTVIHDPYEVRISADELTSVGKKLIKENQSIYKYGVASYTQSYQNMLNLRVGMEVAVVDLTGKNAWAGGQRVVITDLHFNGDVEIKLSSVPVEVSENLNQFVYVFTAPRILNFDYGVQKQREVNTTLLEVTPTPTESLITAINVLDNYLLFTDGKSEPKKINIERAILGNPVSGLSNISSYSEAPCTHLITRSGNKTFAKGFLKESHITTIKPNPLEALEVKLDVSSETQQNSNIQFAQSSSYDGYDMSENLVQFGFYNPSTLTQITEGVPIYLKAINSDETLNSSVEFKINQTLTLIGVSSTARFVLRISAVYSDGTIRCVVIKSQDGYFETLEDNNDEFAEEWIGSLATRSDLYQEKFIRFAYRFRYTDDEYSCISPYSLPAFLPGKYSFEAKTGFNEGMLNTIETITIKNINRIFIPQDVKAVEFLFKDSSTENVYAFKEIKADANGNISPPDINSLEKLTSVKLNKIFNSIIKIENENFGYTLPSDQLTRSSDAVPIKAKAQEIQANRLMYGHYTEGYEMLDGNNSDIDFEITANVESRSDAFTGVFLSNNTFLASQPIGEASTLLFTQDATEALYKDSDNNQLYVSKTLNTSSEATDIGNNFNTTTKVFTAPIDGTYTFKFSAKAIIRSRTDIIQGNPINPFQFFNQETGAFTGNNYVRKHALAIGRVDPTGLPFAASLNELQDDLTSFTGYSAYSSSTSTVGGVSDSTYDVGQYSDLTKWTDHNGQSEFLHTYYGANGDDVIASFPSGVTIDQTTIPPEQFYYQNAGGNFGINNDPEEAYNITKIYVLNDVNLTYEDQFLEVEKTMILSAGDTIGAFALTDQAPANDTGTVVQYTEAVFECVTGPSIELDLTLAGQGLKSVKSDRNYHLGVVYSDQYSRESSVVISEENDIFLDKGFCNKQNAVTAAVLSKAPAWAKTYKIFIKETAVKYHNIVLDGALLNSGSGNTTAYLMFNSADRNKVEVGDILSVKKEQGNNNAVLDPDASFKILDIQGTATTDVDEFDPEASTNVISIGSSTIETSVISEIAQLNGKFFVKVFYNENFIAHIGDLENNGDIESGSLNGAVFETKKNTNIDLDLYYEATQAIPIRLTNELANSIIKPNDRIVLEPQQSSVSIDANLTTFASTPLRVSTSFGSIRGAATESEICFANSGDTVNKVRIKVGAVGSLMGLNEIDIEGTLNNVLVKIYKEDGSFISAFLGENYNPSNDTYIYLNPVIHPTHSHPNNVCPVLLPWFNCYAFGNGVESDTIKDDFNNKELFPYLAAGKASGFKASLPTTKFEQTVKANQIIFSELYNEKNNTNRINEFLLAKDITKTINPDYGSIQKLFSRNNDLLAFCEEKVVRILSQKDALFNADGNMQLTSTNKVLGQSIPFKADYGISKNPESFAYDAYKAYFVDRSRGAVLRLSNDGITVISDYGMKDWFRDHLKSSEVVIGSFDGRKNEYNVTLHEIIHSGITKAVNTISFSEPVNGWTSFKSFIQESGYTIANDYYTAKKGKSYLHHAETPTRNVFYNVKYNSSITPLFNDDASSVKSFRYISYEGSQAKINEFLDDNEYYNLNSKDGWSVEHVKTDLQEGAIKEFINKEGKWFNYIKGESTLFTNFNQGSGLRNVDLSEFSVQGLGNLTAPPTFLNDNNEVVTLGQFESDPNSLGTGGFSITFEAVTLNADGEFEVVDWQSIDQSFQSLGLIGQDATQAYQYDEFGNFTGAGEVYHTVYGQGPSIADEVYYITLQPNPGFLIDQLGFANISNPDEYAPIFTNQDKLAFIGYGNQLLPDLSNYSSGNINEVPSGNVLLSIQIASGIVLTEDITIQIPVLPYEAIDYASELSTQLTFEIQESQTFQQLVDVSEGIATAVASTTRGANYILNIQQALADESATTTFAETGSYTVNSNTTSNEFSYLHSIEIATTEGVSYFVSADEINLMLIPSFNDQGLYTFDYVYENDGYGSLYKVIVNVYYKRFVGQAEATDTIIFIDMPATNVADYEIRATGYGVPLQIAEDPSPNTTAAVYQLSFETEPAYIGEYVEVNNADTNYITDGQTNWIGSSLINNYPDSNTVNVLIQDLDPTQALVREADILFRSSLYPAVTYLAEDGITNLAQKRIIQDDGASLDVSVIADDGSAITTSINGFIISTPNSGNIQIEADGTVGATVYTLEIATDSNAYQSTLGSFISSTVDWIWFDEAGVQSYSTDEDGNVLDVGNYYINFYIGNNVGAVRSGFINVDHPTDGNITSAILINQDNFFNLAVDTSQVQIASGDDLASQSSTSASVNHTLLQTADDNTDTIQVRISLASNVTFSDVFDIDGEGFSFNLTPVGYGSSPENYGKPHVILKANTGGTSYMLNGDEANILDQGAHLIDQDLLIDAGNAVSWDYQFDQIIEENTSILPRSFYVYVYHPQSNSYVDFNYLEPDAGAQALVTQPAADLVFAWAAEYSVYEGGFGDFTISDLDDGDVTVPSPAESDAAAPETINLYIVNSGENPSVAFVDTSNSYEENAVTGNVVNGLGCEASYALVVGSQIAMDDNDSTPLNVNVVKFKWQVNNDFVSRFQNVAIWHSNKDPLVDAPDRVVKLTQDSKEYDVLNNDVKFVNDAGFPTGVVTIEAGPATEDIKVIVKDFNQDAFDEEIQDDNGDFPEGNKRPRFEMIILFAENPPEGDSEDIDINQVIGAVDTITKNPNFPEGVGINFFATLDVFNVIDDLQTGNPFSGFFNLGILAESQEAQSVNDFQLFLNQQNLGNFGNNITVTAPLFAANILDDDGTFPNRLVFEFTPSGIVGTYGDDFILSVLGTDDDPDSIINSNDDEIIGGVLNIDNVVLNEVNKTIIPITGGVTGGAANRLVLKLSALAGAAEENFGLQLNDIKVRALGFTHKISIEHTLNESFSPELYAMNVFHAYNEGNISNDLIQITKLQSEDFDWVNAGSSIPSGSLIFPEEGDTMISNGISNASILLRGTDCSLPPVVRFLNFSNVNKIYDPLNSNNSEPNYNNTALPENAVPYQISTATFKNFNLTSQPSAPPYNLFAANFETEPINVPLRRATINPTIGEQSVSELVGIDAFLNAEFNSAMLDFGTQTTDDQGNIIALIASDINIDINDNGLELGVSHQRYIETFIQETFFEPGIENIELPIKTSALITDGDAGLQYSQQQNFTIGAFVNSPYTNVVDLDDPLTFNIDYSNAGHNADGSSAFTGSLEITAAEISNGANLAWNYENRLEDAEDPNNHSINIDGGYDGNANNVNSPFVWLVKDGYVDLNINVPVAGAEYRVVFTLEEFLTNNEFGAQINTKTRLVRTSNFATFYALDIVNIDKHNGTYIIPQLNDSSPDLAKIRVGEDETDVFDLSEFHFDQQISNTAIGFDHNSLMNNLGFFESTGNKSIVERNSSLIKKTGLVGNNHFIAIVRPSAHGPNAEPVITLRFKNRTSFRLNNLRIEQVTDAYSSTLTDDPLANGADISGLPDLGVGLTDRYNVTQNPFLDSAHAFITSGVDVGSIENSPLASIIINNSVNLTAEEQAFDLSQSQLSFSGEAQMTLQFRSFNTFSVFNGSILAVSVDLGLTFLTEPQGDGGSPLGLNNFATEIPDGVLFGINNFKKKFRIRINPNINAFEATSQRRFIFGLFDESNVVIDNATEFKPITSGIPIQTFSVTQQGTEPFNNSGESNVETIDTSTGGGSQYF